MSLCTSDVCVCGQEVLWGYESAILQAIKTQGKLPDMNTMYDTHGSVQLIAQSLCLDLSLSLSLSLFLCVFVICFGWVWLCGSIMLHRQFPLALLLSLFCPEYRYGGLTGGNITSQAAANNASNHDEVWTGQTDPKLIQSMASWNGNTSISLCFTPKCPPNPTVQPWGSAAANQARNRACYLHWLIQSQSH